MVLLHWQTGQYTDIKLRFARRIIKQEYTPAYYFKLTFIAR